MRANVHAARPTTRFWLILLLVLSMFLPQSGATRLMAADDPATVGQWESVINWDMFGKSLILLQNGKVLVFNYGESATVWDPATGSKLAVPAPFGEVHCAGNVTLKDGRVLIAGGGLTTPDTGLRISSIFDPATNQWSQIAPMIYERWYGTATTLADGRVLMTSGSAPPDGKRVPIPEVYDPKTDTWTALTGASQKLDFYPFMYVVPNGKIYAAGTLTDTSFLDISGTGSWTAGPTNAFGSDKYSESGAMYKPGKIIRAGGGDPAMANTAIIDLNAPNPQWKQVSSMHFARRRLNMTILADGQVLATGGTGRADDLSAAVYEAEIWNPQTEQWTVTSRMTNDRMYHSAALLLPDGRILTSGGEENGKMNAQIYDPPYLFKGSRPTIASSPATINYGNTFSVGFTSGGSAITSVALIRPGAVTHAINMNQRYVPLSFTQAGNSLTVTAPPNAYYAPPGYYMLVIKDSNGVPSVAKWVHLPLSSTAAGGTLTGKVTDAATGVPLAGAAVSYSGGSTTSDSNGNYTLADVPSGQHVFNAAKSGYLTQSQVQSITTGNTSVTLNFALTPSGTPSGTLTGKVSDTVTRQPLVGATVTYSGGSTLTDDRGHYTLANIPLGEYTFTATQDGYSARSRAKVITETSALNFLLTPISGRTVFLPMVRSSATTAARSAEPLYTAFSTTWSDAAAEDFEYACQLKRAYRRVLK